MVNRTEEILRDMNLAKAYKNSNAYTCPYCGWDIKMYVNDARVLFEHHMQSHEERNKTERDDLV